MPYPTPPIFYALLAFMAAYGAWSGWHLPNSAVANNFPSSPLGVVLALLPGIAIGVSAAKSWNSSPYPSAKQPINKLLGNGTYEALFVQAGVLLLLGASALLTGGVSLARGLALGAAASPILMGVFALSGGTGMLWAYSSHARRRHRASDA
jgi:hypothetical protein